LPFVLPGDDEEMAGNKGELVEERNVIRMLIEVSYMDLGIVGKEGIKIQGSPILDLVHLVILFLLLDSWADPYSILQSI
jgi:hypothetical protein